MTISISLSTDEYHRRIDRVKKTLNERERDALCLFNSVSILYLTGFRHTPTERPVVLIVPAEGDPGLLIPQLEVDHVPVRVPWLERVQVYPEYPDLRHPLEYLKDLLGDMKLSGARLAADASGYSAPGYRGPTLADLLDGAEVDLWPHLVESMRVIKSPEEIELVRNSVPFGNTVHRIIQDSIKPGRSEIEISLFACAEGTARMFATLAEMGVEYVGQDNGSIPAIGGLVSGPVTGLPHPLDTNRPIEAGDVIIGWSGGANFDGYSSELERTMILGEPTEEQRRLFNIMLEAQQVALDTIQPGIPASDVDKAVRDYAEEAGVSDMLRHHSGHGKGLQIHEMPFFDQGDNTLLRPGMLMSCEPGFYRPGCAGFRHSDTVLITEDGCEVLTNYPRDLEELVIPA
jgi:Xaa-Pro aminopeptidase